MHFTCKIFTSVNDRYCTEQDKSITEEQRGPVSRHHSRVSDAHVAYVQSEVRRGAFAEVVGLMFAVLRLS